MSIYVSGREIDELEQMMIERHKLLSHQEPIRFCCDAICANAKESIAWLRSRIKTAVSDSHQPSGMLVAVAGIQLVQSVLIA
jgi:hypothetical protein